MYSKTALDVNGRLTLILVPAEKAPLEGRAAAIHDVNVLLDEIFGRVVAVAKVTWVSIGTTWFHIS